jgi:NAD(P)H-dependent FMN reductase
MKIIGINASPRKKANTQTLVEAVLNGAAEKRAGIRMVNFLKPESRYLTLHFPQGNKPFLSFPEVILNRRRFCRNSTII